MVFASMSVSLDGFSAGANDGPDNPMGDRGEELHNWLFDLEGWREPHGLEGGTGGPESDRINAADVGALVMGHRMYMNGERPWGSEPPFHEPVYVVTHAQREPRVADGDTTFYFVNDGAGAALAAARESAGDRDVRVAGGANVIQQLLNAGEIDELELQIVPIVLGAGVPMFDGVKVGFELIDQLQGAQVTHVRYRVTS